MKIFAPPPKERKPVHGLPSTVFVEQEEPDQGNAARLDELRENGALQADEVTDRFHPIVDAADQQTTRLNGAPGQGGERDNPFLFGGPKASAETEKGTRPGIRSASGFVDVKPRFITGGRHGDTFYGERANDRAGSGFADGRNLGHQDGRAAEGEQDAPVPVSYPSSGSSTDTGIPLTHGDNAGVQMGSASGKVAGSARNLTQDRIPVFSEPVKGPIATNQAKVIVLAQTPREDQDGVSGQDLLHLPKSGGKEADRAVLTGGLAGGSQDGRGVDAPATGSSRHVDEALSTRDAAGAPEREPVSATLSMEEALQGNRHTDPKRH
jgi:hypothetical protein